MPLRYSGLAGGNTASVHWGVDGFDGGAMVQWQLVDGKNKMRDPLL